MDLAYLSAIELILLYPFIYNIYLMIWNAYFLFD